MKVDSERQARLEQILEQVDVMSLPGSWRSIDVETFSPNKRLYIFQQQAVKNALKCLYLFFRVDAADKARFFTRYVALDEDLRNRFDRQLSRFNSDLMAEIGRFYAVENNRIAFPNFVNRAAFWMATGSGKTLVIVKLLEFLKRLTDNADATNLPNKDVLVLTHREDLINQLKNFVDEFNQLSIQRGFRIRLVELRDYEVTKRESLSDVLNEFTVFYYRSDLIWTAQKEKVVDFRNYENGGNWYVILDEAHKGDKEESKRQMFYSIMSRNGFLFNFSATFVDPSDIITTAYNFNLREFIFAGYGKHIYLSQQEMAAFKDKEDYDDRAKQKIVLKSLVLLTYLKKLRGTLFQPTPQAYYHEPLMLSLVNTVNLTEVTEKPDLTVFFTVLEQIGRGKTSRRLFDEAKEELVREFVDDPAPFYKEVGSVGVDVESLLKITFDDVLRHVYNSDQPGVVEVITIPGKPQEAVFKLKTSPTPFALIKIGDAVKWLKDNLTGFEVIESYEDKSIFEQLDQREDISILMGSRAFYEGWDSNRPNVILFINIGLGTDARKFVVQSVGRGVRIEPIKHRRKRLGPLRNESPPQDEGLFEKVGSKVGPLESLFVLGTSKTVLDEVLSTLKMEKGLEEQLELAENSEVQIRSLLIPVYKESLRKLYEEERPQKFPILEPQLNMAREYFTTFDDRILIVTHDITPSLLLQVRKSFSDSESFYRQTEDAPRLPSRQLTAAITQHFNLNLEELERFKLLEQEIVHFKRLRALLDSREEIEELKEKIQRVANYPKKQEEEKRLEEEYGKIPKEAYDRKLAAIQTSYPREERFKDLQIKHVIHHYYLPLILSETEKADYITHIVKEESEVKFIRDLERFLEATANQLADLDWWMFSKLDATLDEIYVPYYDPDSHSIEHFKPDFIFWLKKGNNYFIVFVDPKGTKHADYEHKVDGYKRVFEKADQTPRMFPLDRMRVRVLLSLYTEDPNKVAEEYRRHWYGGIKSIFDQIENLSQAS
jgi:hypothetical protein